MKRAKDRYLINQAGYKDLKRYDHKPRDIKGIGIKERLAEFFRKETLAEVTSYDK